jgi:hypothetical protein
MDPVLAILSMEVPRHHKGIHTSKVLGIDKNEKAS